MKLVLLLRLANEHKRDIWRSAVKPSSTFTVLYLFVRKMAGVSLVCRSELHKR